MKKNNIALAVGAIVLIVIIFNGSFIPKDLMSVARSNTVNYDISLTNKETGEQVTSIERGDNVQLRVTQPGIVCGEVLAVKICTEDGSWCDWLTHSDSAPVNSQGMYCSPGLKDFVSAPNAKDEVFENSVIFHSGICGQGGLIPGGQVTAWSTEMDTQINPGWYVISTYTKSRSADSCSGVGVGCRECKGLASLTEEWSLNYMDFANMFADDNMNPDSYKFFFVAPRADNIIRGQEFPIIQGFAAGETVNLKYDKDRWMESFAPFVYRVDTSQTMQDYSVFDKIDAGNYEVPPSSALVIGYISKTGVECPPGEVYYADFDMCDVPGLLLQCNSRTVDGLCVVQPLFNCPLGTFWSDNLQKCVSSTCPEGTYWSKILKTCMAEVDDVCQNDVAEFDLSSGFCALTGSYHQCILDVSLLEPWEADFDPVLDINCINNGCPPKYTCIENTYDVTQQLCVDNNAGELDNGAISPITFEFVWNGDVCYYEPLVPDNVIECPTNFTLSDDKSACVFVPEIIVEDPEQELDEDTGNFVTDPIQVREPTETITEIVHVTTPGDIITEKVGVSTTTVIIIAGAIGALAFLFGRFK